MAIANAQGKGGVGVIRLSGPQAKAIGVCLSNKKLPTRQAVYTAFKDSHGQTLDTGVILYFAAPNSFTGEDIVELQSHGSPVIQDCLVKEAISLGARQARAGEFSERAFINGKIDLSQAEAIADLINSATAEAARGAVRSLQGTFSSKINQLLSEFIYFRTYVEASIDFPDEEIDFLADTQIQNSLTELQNRLTETIAQTTQGSILRNGLRIVLAGKPNTGKSSLLNALAGDNIAIVTDIAGTTRDTVSTTIDLDGLPLHIIDTAGLRQSDDQVEQIGIQRAHQVLADADHVLMLTTVEDRCLPDLKQDVEQQNRNNITVLVNKVDLLDTPLKLDDNSLAISATRGDGLDALTDHLKNIAGYTSSSESVFTARRRHIIALQNAQAALTRGMQQLTDYNAGEILAHELLIAQNELNEITGEFTADDLLGEIFSGFCIGK